MYLLYLSNEAVIQWLDIRITAKSVFQTFNSQACLKIWDLAYIWTFPDFKDANVWNFGSVNIKQISVETKVFKALVQGNKQVSSIFCLILAHVNIK